jgi:hypothetical protein
MLIHQLLKERDFQERCAYCGKDFSPLPQLSRHGDKEYITLSCEHGHQHTFCVDMSRPFDASLIHKEIEANKRLPSKPLEKVIVEH